MIGKPLATAAIAVLLSAAGWAFLQGGYSPPSKTVYHEKSCALTIPAGATLQDRWNFAHNFAFGSTWGTTLSLVDFKGEVKAMLTGLAMQPTGERQLVVTVLDDIPDLTEARVYIAGQLAAIATHANGGILDRNGKALATLSVLVPATAPYDAKVEWTSTTGEVQTAQLVL